MAQTLPMLPMLQWSPQCCPLVRDLCCSYNTLHCPLQYIYWLPAPCSDGICTSAAAVDSKLLTRRTPADGQAAVPRTPTTSHVSTPTSCRRLPVLNAHGEHAVRREEHQQAIRHDARKVDDGVAKVVFVARAGAALVGRVEGRACGTCWHNANPHLLQGVGCSAGFMLGCRSFVQH